MEQTLKDLRHAVRSCRRRPGFTLLAVVSLSLGIGASAAMFNVVDAVILEPLRLDDMDRLVGFTEGPFPFFVSYPLYADFRDHVEPFLELAAYQPPRPASVGGGTDPRLVQASFVSANYFDVLGTGAFAGRSFTEDEERRESVPAAVLGHGFWQRELGGREDVIGEFLDVNRRQVLVVGIAPPGVRGTQIGDPIDLFLSIGSFERVSGNLAADIDLEQTFFHWLNVVGRLRPGISLEEARTRFWTIQEEIGAVRDGEVPEEPVAVQPLTLVASGTGSREELVLVISLLSAGAAVVLLIACANVAQLLLASARHRRREFAIREALGARRIDLARQVILETGILATLGTLLGIPVAYLTTSLFASAELPGDVPLALLQLTPDWRLLTFAATAAATSTILAGLTPALQASRRDLRPALSASGDVRPPSRRRYRALSAVLVVQFAFSALLLVSCGLFVRSVRNAMAIDLGFDPEGVILVDVDLGLERYGEEEAESFYRRLRKEVETLPGFSSAAWSRAVPLERTFARAWAVVPEGGTEEQRVWRSLVGQRFFETLGLDLLEGRAFEPADARRSNPVAVVSRSLAEALFPGGSAVGRVLSYEGLEPRSPEVIGVVSDCRCAGFSEPSRPAFYEMAEQDIESTSRLPMTLMVRTTQQRRDAVRSIDRLAERLDPRIALYGWRTLEDVVGDAAATTRTVALLMGLFSAVAVFLAGLGAYGLVAFTVAQQAHEIAIRRALGAGAMDLLRLSAGRCLAAVGIGLFVGELLATAAARGVAALLYGVEPIDLPTLVVVTVGLLGLAATATLVPVARALKVSPRSTLTAL